MVAEVAEVQYEDMLKHNTSADCWMSIHGKVWFAASPFT